MNYIANYRYVYKILVQQHNKQKSKRKLPHLQKTLRLDNTPCRSSMIFVHQSSKSLEKSFAQHCYNAAPDDFSRAVNLNARLITGT